MCSWRRVAVARVFALVMRCRIMMLFVYSRVGKNRDTRGSPRREPGRPAPPLKFFHFDLKILAVRKPIAYTDLLGAVLILQHDSNFIFKIHVLINPGFEFNLSNLDYVWLSTSMIFTEWEKQYQVCITKRIIGPPVFRVCEDLFII